MTLDVIVFQLPLLIKIINSILVANLASSLCHLLSTCFITIRFCSSIKLFLWESGNAFIHTNLTFSHFLINLTQFFSILFLRDHSVWESCKSIDAKLSFTASGQIGLWSHGVGLHQSNFFQKLCHPSKKFLPEFPITLFLGKSLAAKNIKVRGCQTR